MTWRKRTFMHEPACWVSDPVRDGAANDNCGAGWSEPLMDALRLFAQAGVAAPQVARDAARAAEAAGDTATASDWREIGRMFSPRRPRRGKPLQTTSAGRSPPMS